MIESAAGNRIASAVLIRSSRPATIAPDVALSIGAAGRTAFEALRR